LGESTDFLGKGRYPFGTVEGAGKKDPFFKRGEPPQGEGRGGRYAVMNDSIWGCSKKKVGVHNLNAWRRTLTYPA